MESNSFFFLIDDIYSMYPFADFLKKIIVLPLSRRITDLPHFYLLYYIPRSVNSKAYLAPYC